MTQSALWQQVDQTATCWNWTGKVNGSGYGPHRKAYAEQVHGPVHPHLYVLHHCDNRRCVRLDHLFQGTQVDNMKDMITKGRSRSYRWTKEDNPNKGKSLPDHLKKAMSERKKRPFHVIDPTGALIEGINLTEFCRANSLNQGAMWLVITGSGGRISHKGYTKVP